MVDVNRSEVFVNIQHILFIYFFFLGGGSGWGGQDGCERRIEVFVKIKKKKKYGGGGGGVRVDMNEELKVS